MHTSLANQNVFITWNLARTADHMTAPSYMTVQNVGFKQTLDSLRACAYTFMLNKPFGVQTR